MGLKQSAIVYARLTRFQTVPLEMVPATVGAVVATGSLFDWQVLPWVVFGVLYHLVGYGQNSLEDWKRGWDTDDPNKQHHPLNAGMLTQRQADLFVYGLFAVTILYTAAIVSSWVAFALFVTGLPIAGTLYNTIGKQTRWKFLFIAYSHVTVFAVPYYSIAGTVDPILLLGSLYLFVWVVFQIAISGEIKDLAQDEANVLKELGSDIKSSQDGHLVEFSRSAQGFAYGIRGVAVVLSIAFGSVVAQQFGQPGPLLFGVGITELTLAAVGVLSVVLTWSMVQSGPYNRAERVGTMAKIELLSLLKMLVAVFPIIGIPSVVFLFVVSGAWVMVCNKIEWGTLVAPNV